MEAKVWSTKGWVNHSDADYLKSMFNSFLKAANFDVISFNDHRFEGYGYTAIWLLAESHFAIHTFPEQNKSYIDMTSCNEFKQNIFNKLLFSHFQLQNEEEKIGGGE